MVTKTLRNFIKTIVFLKYRYQYLINYIIIGFFSVLLETLVVRYFFSSTFPTIPKLLIGFILGVLLAFILNARINFKVPKSRNARTFLMFLIISTIAFSVNLVLIYLLKGIIPMGYTNLRLLTAAVIFLLSYTAHRKITFNFIKKVGIAVYLNRKVNILGVYSRIKHYADFIHIDLIDKTFDKNIEEIDLSQIKEIEKSWGLKKILHIMSDNPSIWINKLYNHVDIIVFHLEIEESIQGNIELCRKLNKKVGICLKTDSSIKDIMKYLPRIDYIQIMGIDEIGKSGRHFNPESIEKVNELDRLRKTYKFDIIFDGGVKPTNIGRINARYIVSASGILLSEDPIKSFLELKTSSRYRAIEREIREDLIKKIGKICDNLDFIVSGNLVGSFSKNQGIDSLNDIDIVLIADELKKEKFNKIIEEFRILQKEIESKYGYKVVINNTLGPLKFNKDNIVFHLMLYDINSHIRHCLNSPFTCYDWQLSKIFFKQPMSDIFKVRFIQPANFLGSRRSVKEYLEEISSNKLSYREYKLEGEKIIEEKKFKTMDSRDRIEFSFHILRFLMVNLLKLYYKENQDFGLKETIKYYFKIFPKNKKIHGYFFKNLSKLKEKRIFNEPLNLIKKTENFIIDFENQFRNYFLKDSREVYFIRHMRTKTQKNQFIGQKYEPETVLPNKESIQRNKELLKDSDKIISSPSKRCIRTLGLLSIKQPHIDRRIAEIDYGNVDGKDLEYLKSNYPKIVQAWEFGEDPRFPNGENYNMVLDRIYSFLDDLKKSNSKKITVCTHNVVLRILIGIYLRIPKKYWYKLNIPNFEPIKFQLTKDNIFYIELSDNQIMEILKNL